MKPMLKPGVYVVAVSGGVDSMALLDMLAKDVKLKLVVAHFDHGIREDSGEDRTLVEQAAARYGAEFVFEEGFLGPYTSEAKARTMRYAFLHRMRREYKAQAIVTAHHQDDVLETVFLNIIRGTGRRGFTSLASGELIKRPFLDVTKQQLQEYAEEHKLAWHEDSTNTDDRYLRNHLRLNILPKMTNPQREQLLALLARMREINKELDEWLNAFLLAQPPPARLERHQFIMLPHGLSLEVMAAWLRSQAINNYDRKGLLRLTQFAKTAQPGKRMDVDIENWLQADADNLALIPRDR